MVKRPITPPAQADEAVEAAAMAPASTDQATTVDTTAAASETSATGASEPPKSDDQAGTAADGAPASDVGAEATARAAAEAEAERIGRTVDPAVQDRPSDSDIARLFELEAGQVLSWRLGVDELVVVTNAGRKLRIRRGSTEVEAL